MAEDRSMTTEVAIDSLYMMHSTFLLALIVVGLCLFYSGLTQRRSSFVMLGMPMVICAFLFIDWYIWGYSLCYGTSTNHFIGSLKFVVIHHLGKPSELIYSTPRGDILAVIHFLFNGFMKLICATLTFPACGTERGRIIPMLVFIFFWSAMVYNPVTYWFWNENGWLSPQLNRLPVLDFAGGNCIHVVSGFTALAYSFYLGPRNPEIIKNYRSSNNAMSFLGLTFILFGWCGFISGCDFQFSVTTFYLIVSTFLCAFVAGIFWMAIDFYYSAIPLESDDAGDDSTSTQFKSPSLAKHFSAGQQKRRTLSVVSFGSGVMCGLVVFTPGGGYLCYSGNFWKSIICGALGGVIGNLSTRLKYFFSVDDALDIFAVHGVCGIVGSLFVGIFAEDSYDSRGGWVVGHWVQLGYQLLGSVVTSLYVFLVSLFFLYIVDLAPGMHLRIDKGFNRRTNGRKAKDGDFENNAEVDNDSAGGIKAELLGSDFYELNGEYSMDFIEFMKVIDPKDYESESDSHLHDHACGPFSSGYDEMYLRKREIGQSSES